MSANHSSDFYTIMNGDGTTDYELYLNTHAILTAQKKFEDLCNEDELQFQLVHQAEELMFKLLNYTLVEINQCMQAENTNRVLTYFSRAHKAQNAILTLIEPLHTMSPKEYQAIRLQLGNGSGQESPGFRTFLKLAPTLWETFIRVYLQGDLKNIEKIYNTEYSHGPSYMVAEAFVELDDKYNKFLYHHMKLIGRSIGLEAHSLKGRVVTGLNARVGRCLFPELLEIRSQMTSEWGGQYGVRRDSISVG